MGRRGIERARTGCVTCKLVSRPLRLASVSQLTSLAGFCRARKVKCDETRPECSRCKTKGVACGGYRPPPVGWFPWAELLQAQPLTQPSPWSLVDSDSGSRTEHSMELRGIEFFHSVVAPALGASISATSYHFWNTAILQQAMHDTVVRHALLAVSSLYEYFDTVPHGQEPQGLCSDKKAMEYYQVALRRLAASKRLERNTALFAAVLFTSFEFLSGDHIRAIQHCQHGIRILDAVRCESTVTMSESDAILTSVFHHLSIFPLFFGATIAISLALAPPARLSHDFYTISGAVEAMDDLMSQCARLVRAWDPFRSNLDPIPIPSGLLLWQKELGHGLEGWLSSLQLLKAVRNMKSEEEALTCLLEMRWLVCSIWAAVAGSSEETASVVFRTQFEDMIHLAQRIECLGLPCTAEKTPVLFSFEMELLPLLHFVFIKSRFISLRLKALRLLQTLSRVKEATWDAHRVYAMVSRTIELKHDLVLDSPECVYEWTQRDEAGNCYIPPSPDEAQIRNSFHNQNIECYIGDIGKRELARRVNFILFHMREGAHLLARNSLPFVYE